MIESLITALIYVLIGFIALVVFAVALSAVKAIGVPKGYRLITVPWMLMMMGVFTMWLLGVH